MLTSPAPPGPAVRPPNLLSLAPCRSATASLATGGRSLTQGEQDQARLHNGLKKACTRFCGVNTLLLGAEVRVELFWA